jgi:RNA polymerase sigma factor (sigma-70 family)
MARSTLIMNVSWSREPIAISDSFGELYLLHVGAVFGYAFRCCGSQSVAEEVTSATFEQALRGIAKFEWRGSGLRPWLLRIASHEVANFYRRQERAIGDRAQSAIRELMLTEPEVGVESETIIGLRIAEMRTALAQLHPRYQKAITLRYLAVSRPTKRRKHCTAPNKFLRSPCIEHSPRFADQWKLERLSFPRMLNVTPSEPYRAFEWSHSAPESLILMIVRCRPGMSFSIGGLVRCEVTSSRYSIPAYGRNLAAGSEFASEVNCSRNE